MNFNSFMYIVVLLLIGTFLLITLLDLLIKQYFIYKKAFIEYEFTLKEKLETHKSISALQVLLASKKENN